MPSVFVSGAPEPQGSAKGFAVKSKQTGKYRAVITHANAQTMPWRRTIVEALNERSIDMIDGPVGIELAFVLPRRKAEPKRTTPPHIRKPDLDKLARAVCDAMTGIVFVDDSRVVDLRATKRTALIGESPGVQISWEEVL